MSNARVLYSSPACPFAHRTVALLNTLELPFDLRNTSLYLKDPELMRRSPTGKVPLLLEPDGTLLYESSVIAEYLAERYGFEDGLANEPALRAEQRLAIKQFDAVVVKLLYYRDIRAYPLRYRTPKESRTLHAELDRLEALTSRTPPQSLLGLHIAPFWLRFQWLSFLIGAEATLRERPVLAAWLDEAATLPSIQAAADEEAFVRQYRLMKRVVWGAFALAVAILILGGTVSTAINGLSRLAAG